MPACLLGQNWGALQNACHTCHGRDPEVWAASNAVASRLKGDDATLPLLVPRTELKKQRTPHTGSAASRSKAHDDLHRLRPRIEGGVAVGVSGNWGINRSQLTLISWVWSPNEGKGKIALWYPINGTTKASRYPNINASLPTPGGNCWFSCVAVHADSTSPRPRGPERRQDKSSTPCNADRTS